MHGTKGLHRLCSTLASLPADGLHTAAQGVAACSCPLPYERRSTNAASDDMLIALQTG